MNSWYTFPKKFWEVLMMPASLQIL
jgi:hypothetical protein